AGLSDLVKCTFQCRTGDALAAVLLVDVEARDPPVRTRRRVLRVFTPVLDTGELLRAAVLAPSLHGAALVEYQRSMRAAFPDAALLPGTVLRSVRPGQLGVEAHAPASSKDPVVAFDQLREGIPCRSVERPDRVRQHRVLSCRTGADPRSDPPAWQNQIHHLDAKRAQAGRTGNYAVTSSHADCA